MEFTNKNPGRNRKNIAVIILCCLLLCLCWRLGRAWEPDGEVKPAISGDTSATFLDFTPAERQTQPEKPRRIDLSDSDFAISEGGEYCLTGSRESTLKIDAPGQTVHLYLDNAVIKAKEGPAIACLRGEKLIITALADTENILADSGLYDLQSELTACVDVDCDLILNGSGKINVTGLHKDAIRSSDRLKLLDIQLDIRCKRTGLHGNDGIAAENTGIVIAAEKNGFRTTKKGADGRGSILIQGGDLSVTAGRYAFLAEKGNIYLADCGLNLRSVLSDFGGEGSVYAQEGVLP